MRGIAIVLAKGSIGFTPATLVGAGHLIASAKCSKIQAATLRSQQLTTAKAKE